MRILYVEDNETNQALVGRVVRAKQHSIVFREEGEGALDILAEDANIDLVLLDIELAGVMSGLDVVKTLRARKDKRPVVAVTAYAMMGDRERILAAGCDQYLPKPLVITDLLAVMEHYESELAARQDGDEKAEVPVAAPPEPAGSTADDAEKPTPEAATEAPAPALVPEPAGEKADNGVKPAPEVAVPPPADANQEPAADTVKPAPEASAEAPAAPPVPVETEAPAVTTDTPSPEPVAIAEPGQDKPAGEKPA